MLLIKIKFYYLRKLYKWISLVFKFIQKRIVMVKFSSSKFFFWNIHIKRYLQKFYLHLEFFESLIHTFKLEFLYKHNLFYKTHKLHKINDFNKFTKGNFLFIYLGFTHIYRKLLRTRLKCTFLKYEKKIQQVYNFIYNGKEFNKVNFLLRGFFLNYIFKKNKSSIVIKNNELSILLAALKKLNYITSANYLFKKKKIKIIQKIT